MMNRFSTWTDCPLPAVIATLMLCLGCAGEPAPSAAAPEAVANVAARNLGWLGAAAMPVAETVSVVDPDGADKTLYPGAVEICELQADGWLAGLGLRVGDRLVGIGEEMLPTKEDPTIDLMRLVEGEVSAQQPEILIHYVREGDLLSVSASVELVPLEQGLPLAIERYRQIASRAAGYLAQHQADDGSFAPAGDDRDARLIVSSLCGLAMYHTGNHAEAVQQCVAYVTSQVDDPGISDPLVAAYVLMFLVEVDPPPAHTDRLARCLQVIRESQTESGAWLPRPDDEDEPACDPQGTFATNQVLLALGIAERDGFVGPNDVIEKAVAYLKTQAKLRIAADIDRRTKAGLSAGSAAAMVVLNMDRADPLVTRLRKEAFRLAEDIPQSRTLAVPHGLAAALISRQSGVATWIDHHRHAKLMLSQLQRADGSFESVPIQKSQPLEWENRVAGDCWQTAHYALIAQLQEPGLAAFSAEQSHPMLVARDGDGKPQAAGSSGSQTPQIIGGLQLDLDGLDPSSLSPEELQEKLMEKLKEQGVDVSGANIQIMSSGDAPPDPP